MNKGYFLLELWQYCIEQGTKNVDKALRMDDPEDKAYHRGKAMAFLWIAGCIQNERLGEPDEDDRD